MFIECSTIYKSKNFWVITDILKGCLEWSPKWLLKSFEVATTEMPLSNVHQLLIIVLKELHVVIRTFSINLP